MRSIWQAVASISSEMDRIAESIEALADAFVASKCDRATFVKSLQGFARFVASETQAAPIRASQELDALIRRWKQD